MAAQQLYRVVQGPPSAMTACWCKVLPLCPQLLHLIAHDGYMMGYQSQSWYSRCHSGNWKSNQNDLGDAEDYRSHIGRRLSVW